MTTTGSKKEGEKLHHAAEKKLGMQGQSPNIPVMFTKGLHVISSNSTCRGNVHYATLKNQNTPLCPHCGSECYVHGSRYRKAKFMNREGAIKDLRIKIKRFKCRSCSITFSQDTRELGIMPYARRNEKLNRAIGKKMSQGLCNKHIAQEFNISTSTVERTLHKVYHQHVKEVSNYSCPLYLGIDEHSIHKGKRYAVTLVDLKNHRVYEVIEGKNTAKLEAALRKLKGREKVKMVCMDLCTQFRSVVQRLFPQAKIVADRFHVIRVIIETLLNYCKEVEPDIRWQRGIINVLRKNNSNLTVKQNQLLEKVLNDKTILRPAYEFKEKLCELLRLKAQTPSNCKKHLKKLKVLMEKMKYESDIHFKRLYKTMSSWFTPIIRMWRFTLNNGITEGFHRKMKLIQRRAFGFRNFENYRLRVLVECSGHPIGTKK